MFAMIDAKRSQIDALCTRFGVKRLELFGSALDDRFDPARSDVDFFVEFHDVGWKGSFKRYMGLKLALEDLLEKPVDLVEPHAVKNPYFLPIATKHRRLLYAA
jgi:predicted nucleotidyltransferase